MIANAAAVSLLGALLAWQPPPGATWVPSSQYITPTAAPGSTYQELNPGLKDFPNFVAGQPISLALSPDHKTLVAITSGYNNNYDQAAGTAPGWTPGYLPIVVADSNEYVFVFDVSQGKAVQKQVLQVPDTYVGLAFSPDGSHFYVSGGGDDEVHVFAQSSGTWAEVNPPLALGHTSGNGLEQGPTAQGLAVTADGTRLVVANRYNDSISVVELATGKVVDQDLRPGKSGGVSGTPGGEYPNSVAIAGNATAYVSSERDREIVVVDISGATPSVKTRIPVLGNPNRMVLSASQDTLYVTTDNADLLYAISTSTNQVKESTPTVGPDADRDDAGLPRYRGASPNSIALSPDGHTLYVTNRGTNSIAVIERDHLRVRGLIPTAWYPSDVVADGSVLYVVNTKSVPGPNPGNCLGYQTYPCPVANTPVKFEANEYIENLNKGGLQTVPVPDRETLERLTWRVAENNNAFYEPGRRDRETFEALRKAIHHVIYIIKENRTYDQILGDLGVGNGDPSLAEFPKATTPNLHAAASQFVALDNFFASGEVSGNGWPWSTSGRESDAGAKMLPVNYACSPLGGPGCNFTRGGSYDWEGTNRNVNVGLSGAARIAADPLAATLDPDTLPGTGNVAAPDGPGADLQQGYLWNAALRKGLTVRNYGFLIDLTRYSLSLLGSPATKPFYIARQTPPFAKTGATPDPFQAYGANPQLASLTDPYFRGFDTGYADFYREQEWESEFDAFVASGNLPNLSLVRLMADHTGNYGNAISGVNTPELEVADNDYAVGRLLAAVAKSPYAKDTLVFIVEDDAQDGPDHVDAHRTTAFVVGPYVKHGAVVNHRYTTVNLIRTITEVLGVGRLGLYDTRAEPMTDVFDLDQKAWSFEATPSALLSGTTLPLPTAAAGPRLLPTHDAAYWAEKTRGMNFSKEDLVDAARYNRILWEGLMGAKPYPASREKAPEAKAARKTALLDAD